MEYGNSSLSNWNLLHKTALSPGYLIKHLEIIDMKTLYSKLRYYFFYKNSIYPSY